MKLRQQARVLKRKALTSFITAAEAFNSPRDDGRVTKVLLHLQHAFEMLLKATLVADVRAAAPLPRTLPTSEADDLPDEHDVHAAGETAPRRGVYGCRVTTPQVA